LSWRRVMARVRVRVGSLFSMNALLSTILDYLFTPKNDVICVTVTSGLWT